MGLAALVATVWLLVSIPVSIVLGFVLRGDDRELIAVVGDAALYLMPDGTLARTRLTAAA